ncbi:MAG: hypothetical protein KID02_15225 [Clostridiales bacterium]|nr:hypothetical protein [Clostridiales bacterium]
MIIIEHLTDIIEVVESTYHKEANAYLELGWSLLSVNVISSPQSSINGPCYILGWNKSNGSIKYPKQANGFDRLRDMYDQATSDFVNS